MIQDEHRKACEKHPKFCDMLINKKTDWEWQELFIKKVNDNGSPYYGENLILEEIAEALHAYQKGDYDNALQELAQCGAVILRMMQYVEETKWAHQGDGK